MESNSMPKTHRDRTKIYLIQHAQITTWSYTWQKRKGRKKKIVKNLIDEVTTSLEHAL